MFYIYRPKGLEKILILIISFVVFVTGVKAEELPLMLHEAERIALESDSLIESISAKADALNYQSVADGQLSDPKLKVGAMNFPLDSFSRNQEPMTQLQVGVQQMFPRGKTLQYNQNKTTALSAMETQRAANQRIIVLRLVRKAYLELYLQVQSEQILNQNENLFSQLLDITQRHYAVGRDNQHDVLRAQLELSLLQDKLAEIDGLIKSGRANLAKWVGYEHALRPLQVKLPELSEIPPLNEISEVLHLHPLIRAQDNLVAANKQQIGIAEEQYKPGWMFDVTYGGRAGRNLDGSSRADFFSAMVLVDIPLFTNKRQDKRLAASQKRYLAAKFARTDQVKELNRMAGQSYARWEQLQERLNLYSTRTLIDASQNSEATLKAYQSDVTDFTTLMRARLTELNTQLSMLRLSVEKVKVEADLHYFMGDES